ncbi:class I SAM-dependent methyltransferase [Porticoccaceae bacterium]|nr:class I SAM-dependent methyltransferase [Porticoccaceae bacterium]
MAKNNSPHFADKYFDEIDEFSEEENYFMRVLDDVIPKLKNLNSKILDVGCGTGLFMMPLVKAGHSLFGVDGASNYIDRAIRRGYKGVKVVADLNVCALPEENESFDMIVCKDVFEHLLNPTHALSEISRVLKKDGLFLLHVPNHFPLRGRLKFLWDNNIDTFSFFEDESRWTFPHIRFYEYDDSLSTLNGRGFELVLNLSGHFISIPLISRFKIFNPISKYLATRFPNQFASGFTLLMRKK